MNKAKAFFFSFSCLLLLFIFSEPVCAQEPIPSQPGVSAPGEEEEEDLQPVPITELDSLGNLPVEVADTVLTPVPGTAAFYSAVLPGMGQAYNNSHWKIPIIYVGAAFLVTQIKTYNKDYSRSVRNLNTIQFEGVPEIDNGDLSYWDRRSSFYRRQRDYFIILGGVLYMMNIVEAYVDAHLQDFDVNDDLAIQFKPALMATGPGGGAGAGIALTLKIK